MDSFEEIKIVTLKDGSEIRLNDDELTIEKLMHGEVISSIELAYPSAGYAGGSVYVSPSEKYILFAYYSGQSEEAFILLTHNEDITLLYDSGYLFGEAASYCFTMDEGTLIQALPYSCIEWWMPWIDGDTEKDEEGNVYFAFGSINIFDIHRGELMSHEILIYPESGWKPDEQKYDPLLLPEMIGDNFLKLSWPWEVGGLRLPITEKIIFKFVSNTT